MYIIMLLTLPNDLEPVSGRTTYRTKFGQTSTYKFTVHNIMIISYYGCY